MRISVVARLGASGLELLGCEHHCSDPPRGRCVSGMCPEPGLLDARSRRTWQSGMEAAHAQAEARFAPVVRGGRYDFAHGQGCEADGRRWWPPPAAACASAKWPRSVPLVHRRADRRAGAAEQAETQGGQTGSARASRRRSSTPGHDRRSAESPAHAVVDAIAATSVRGQWARRLKVAADGTTRQGRRQLPGARVRSCSSRSPTPIASRSHGSAAHEALRALTRRSCLPGLARRLQIPVLTADRDWAGLPWESPSSSSANTLDATSLHVEVAAETKIARKDARKRSSPPLAGRCTSLQRRNGPFAASFSPVQVAAVRLAGLLIPRSQVRPAGPSRNGLQKPHI